MKNCNSFALTDRIYSGSYSALSHLCGLCQFFAFENASAQSDNTVENRQPEFHSFSVVVCFLSNSETIRPNKVTAAGKRAAPQIETSSSFSSVSESINTHPPFVLHHNRHTHTAHTLLLLAHHAAQTHLQVGHAKRLKQRWTAAAAAAAHAQKQRLNTKTGLMQGNRVLQSPSAADWLIEGGGEWREDVFHSTTLKTTELKRIHPDSSIMQGLTHTLTHTVPAVSPCRNPGLQELNIQHEQL